MNHSDTLPPNLRSEEILRIENDGAHQTVILNRPERLNALNQPLSDALLEHFESLRRNTSVRVVTIQGAGKGFCAGADLKSLGQPSQLRDGPDGDWQLRDLLRAMRQCPQPIIGQINGPAVGGGLAIALACDVLIMAKSATLQTSFIKLGLSGSELGVGWRLQRQMGVSLARLALLANRPIQADEAFRCGLAAAVLPSDDLAEFGKELAQDMLGAAPDALRLTKRSLDAALECPSLDASMEHEERAQMLMLARGDLLVDDRFTKR